MIAHFYKLLLNFTADLRFVLEACHRTFTPLAGWSTGFSCHPSHQLADFLLNVIVCRPRTCEVIFTQAHLIGTKLSGADVFHFAATKTSGFLPEIPPDVPVSEVFSRIFLHCYRSAASWTTIGFLQAMTSSERIEADEFIGTSSGDLSLTSCH